MPAPRAVLDTNVLLSALLFRTGRLAALRRAWQSGRVIPLACRQTLDELTRCLAYRKFQLTESAIACALAELVPHVEVMGLRTDRVPAAAAALRCRDPKDQMFLDLAHQAQANCLVTGDDDLLSLRAATAAAGGFRILSPAEFLGELALEP